MKIVIQRVKKANVSVDEKTIGKISQGFCILVGITDSDELKDVEYLVRKVSKLRVFSDDSGKMNLSIKEINGEILSISQFTLYADTRKGNRPSFTNAAQPEYANKLYEQFNELLRKENINVETGQFGADMSVSLINDGPVTIVMESKDGN